jgi:HAD superfamily hydrolase (TIGR01549 family)
VEEGDVTVLKISQRLIEQLTQVKAVVFDLDNTLVSSSLDFAALREELYCPADRDLLLHVESQRCKTIKNSMENTILEHELRDAQRSTPMLGAIDLLAKLRKAQFHLAIVTRNCRKATLIKTSENNINVDQIICREDYPAKPRPESLIALCQIWGLQPKQLLYVGDHLYDIKTAHNAGSLSCYISHANIKKPNMTPSLCLDELTDLHDLLNQIITNH